MNTNNLNNEFIQEVASLYTYYYEAQLGITLVEELSNEADSKYFISANNELKAALHHIMRAFDKFHNDPTDISWRVEFIKAGEEHLNRAIFDAYSYLIDSLIIEQEGFMKRFSPSEIFEVLPTYYSNIIPETEKFREEVAIARISRTLESLQSLKKMLLDNIFVNNRLVLSSKAKLYAAKRRRRFSVFKTYLIGGVIGVIGSLVASYLYENKNTFAKTFSVEQSKEVHSVPSSKDSTDKK